MLRLSRCGSHRPPESSPPAQGGLHSDRPAVPAAGRTAAPSGPWRLFRAGTVRALAAPLALAGLAVLAAPQAQAQSTLVSNTGQTQTGTLIVGTDSGFTETQAQRFTTGDNEDGYVLSSVQLSVASNLAASDQPQISIYQATAAGAPDTSLYTLTNPTTFTNNGLNAFTAPANATLAKETKYFVVVEEISGESFNVNRTTNNSEDSGHANGWSIHNSRHTNTDGGSWGTSNNKLMIDVIGTIVSTTTTVPGAPRNLAATAGDTEVTLTWDAPTSDGGESISRYAFRYKTTGNYPSSWTRAGDGAARSTIVTGLTNDTEHTFQVRAVNSVGPGTESGEATATPVAQLIITTAACTTGLGTERTAVWSGKVTVGSTSGPVLDQTFTFQGYNGEGTPSRGMLDDTGFTYRETPHTIDRADQTRITRTATGVLDSSKLLFSFTSAPEDAVEDRMTLHVDADSFPFTDATYSASSYGFTWDDPGLDSWPAGSSIEFCITAKDVPAAPTGLTATANGPTEINVSWDAPSDDGGPDITGYRIEVSSNGTDWTDRVANTNSTVTTYSHTGLSLGNTRHYRVSAINAVGTSAVSNTDSATTADAATCATPDTSGRTEIWTATVTVGEIQSGALLFAYGYHSSAGGALSDRTFDVGVNSYTFSELYVQTEDTTKPGALRFRVAGGIPDEDRARLRLHVCGDAFDLDDAKDVGNGIYRFNDAGLDWSSASTVKVALSTAPNNSPTGVLTITGTPQVGETLTADTSAIMDADGLSAPGYSYQWFVVKFGAPVLLGTDSPTYRPTTFEIGLTIQVRVTFTDDGGTVETLTSAETAVVVAAGTCAAPDVGGRTEIWTATLTVEAIRPGPIVVGHGYHSSAGALSDRTFDVGANSYTFGELYVQTSNAGQTAGALRFSVIGGIPDDDRDRLRLHVCGDAFDLGEATDASPIYRLEDAGLDWSSETTIKLALSGPPASEYTSATFDRGRIEFTVDARTTGKGDPIGDPVTANGPAGDTLTYSIRNASPTHDDLRFVEIDASTGQLTAKVPFDPLTLPWVEIYVGATDSHGGSDSVYVRIALPLTVPTGAPGSPVAVAEPVAGSDTSIAVSGFVQESSWGASAVTHFDLRYSERSVEGKYLWHFGPRDVPAGPEYEFHPGYGRIPVNAVIEDLDPGTDYYVSLRAANAHGDGKWWSGVVASTTGTVLEQTATDPLTAEFTDLPPGHDGATAFTLRLALTDDVGNTVADVRDHAFAVTGGTLLDVRQVDSRADLWELEIEPEGAGAVGIVLASGACGDPGVLCTGDGRGLTTLLAHSIAGPAPVGGATALTASFADVPPEHDGTTPFDVRLNMSANVVRAASGKTVRDAMRITGGEVTRIKRIGEDQPDRIVTVRPTGFGPVTLTLPATLDCAAPQALCTEEGGRLESEVETTISGPPVAISVANAEVEEAPGAKLKFEVTLDQAATGTVTVDYETVDGTATGGANGWAGDYVMKSGTLTFSPGKTRRVVRVLVADDFHDEGFETMTLRLSNPTGARIAVGQATGRITNSDVMPQAWLARFGRTASVQTADAIRERLAGGRRASADNHLTVGGRRVDGLFGAFRDAARHTGADNAAAARDGDGAASDRRLEPESTWERMDRLKAEAMRWGAAPGGAVPGSLAGGGSAPGGPAAGGAADGRHGLSLGGSGGGAPVSGGAAIAGPLVSGTPGAGSPSGGVPSAGSSPSAGLGDVLSAGLASGRLGGLMSNARSLADLLSTGSDDWTALLVGSSFDYSRTLDGGTGDGGGLSGWSAWGRAAETRFSGADGALSIDGEVATATVGADAQWGRWLAGVAVSHSVGEGGYTHATAAGGEVTSRLTSLNPYANFDVNERINLWGTLGYGVGELSLTAERAEQAIATGLQSTMAAFGGRGVFARREGGLELAVVSDALIANTVSEAATGLMGAEGASSRVRLMLEGSGSMALSNGAVLRPRLEAGLRYDGGDAETGAGLEIGGALAYAAGRLSVELSARGLLAHESADYEEWGFSGSVKWQPNEAGRGFTMDAGSSWGDTGSGVNALWSRQDASGIVRGAGMEATQRYHAELGYGLEGRRGRALWVPFFGTDASDGQQAYRMGVKLTSDANLEAGLEIGRRTATRGQVENAIQLQGAVRF